MSFTPSKVVERRHRVSDPKALRALAHPLRLALLDRLMSFGEQTAAQCAEAVGSTASNCSYHLRALARVGSSSRAARAIVVSVRGGRRRRASSSVRLTASSPAAAERGALRWRSCRWPATRSSPARRAGAISEQPAEWRAAEAFHSYALRLTAAELSQLVDEIDRLVRPFIAMTRDDAPGMLRWRRCDCWRFVIPSRRERPPHARSP